MPSNYYEPKDLADFPNIAEFAPKQGAAFFDYYTKSTSAGSLTEREKILDCIDGGDRSPLSLLYRRLYDEVLVAWCFQTMK